MSPSPSALSSRRPDPHALVVDCDVHHGNGTAAIFAGDRSVFTLSIHHFNNYPTEKPPSSMTSTWPTPPATRTISITSPRPRDRRQRLPPGHGLLRRRLDPYYDDQPGGLSLTRKGCSCGTASSSTSPSNAISRWWSPGRRLCAPPAGYGRPARRHGPRRARISPGVEIMVTAARSRHQRHGASRQPRHGRQ
ncbi:MAG: hypothetical protein IPP47_00620 [Bryobacterales bacterium]|nr:hypothetical protein [Bryobacterales bacterium]